MKNDYYSLLRIVFLIILSFSSLYSQAFATEGYQAFQQSSNLVVSGRVISSADAQGIPGVNILVKNTSIGTVTDIDGSYSITLPTGSETLVFSSIGFITKEVAVNGKAILDIILDEDMQNLDEVVVVGYSSKQLSQLSSSVAVVSGEKLNDVTSNDVTGLLQGKAAGVIVSNSSEDPNASPNIVIRGSSSINAGASPLYVVDGIIGGNANPKDIESVTILKDAAATGLYGSRAANGVIIITIKSGQAGETRIDWSSTVGS